ncbi:MAG: helix-turn-helix transcriptional regulator [bacterium]
MKEFRISQSGKEISKKLHLLESLCIVDDFYLIKHLTNNQKCIYLDNNCQDNILSMQKVETFGEKLRKLREDNEMPLRKLAAQLDIDQSTLSKIERNERSANLDLIERISKIFKVSKKDLRVAFLSDQIAYKVLDEDYGVEALQVAENKLTYLRNLKK